MSSGPQGLPQLDPCSHPSISISLAFSLAAYGQLGRKLYEAGISGCWNRPWLLPGPPFPRVLQSYLCLCAKGSPTPRT